MSNINDKTLTEKINGARFVALSRALTVVTPILFAIVLALFGRAVEGIDDDIEEVKTSVGEVKARQDRFSENFSRINTVNAVQDQRFAELDRAGEILADRTTVLEQTSLDKDDLKNIERQLDRVLSELQSIRNNGSNPRPFPQP